jgi:hypothetical protein
MDTPSTDRTIRDERERQQLAGRVMLVQSLLSSRTTEINWELRMEILAQLEALMNLTFPSQGRRTEPNEITTAADLSAYAPRKTVTDSTAAFSRLDEFIEKQQAK